jgi:Flp pilus assembly protein TadD
MMFASSLLSLVLLGAPSVGQAAQTQVSVSAEETATAFAPYNEAMAIGQKTRAADQLLTVINDVTLGEHHGQAWVLMGDLLASFDMAFSALIAYNNAILANPEVAAPSIKAAISIAEKLGDEALLAPALAANVGLDVDTDTRSRMAYLAARENFIQGKLGVATAMLMMVDAKSATFAESEALRGILLSQQGRFNDALVPLITARQVGQNANLGDRFDNMMTLNLARAYFGAGNFPNAIETFATVDRDSDFWPEAAFERAWAHFRLEDVNGALGQLHNLRTNFFTDWYFPEADLLQTYSLFLMCKFPDATKSVEAFAEAYTPIKIQLDSALATATPDVAWADVNAHLEARSTKLPTKVLTGYASEDRITNAIDTVARADDEITRLGYVSASPFAAQAKIWLQNRRDQIVQIEGARIIENARSAKTQLDAMLYNVDITKLDMMQYEADLYSQASNTGKLNFGDPIGKLRRMSKKRGVRVWPYEGEEWGDELGYYRYDARPDCPAGLAQTTEGS